MIDAISSRAPAGISPAAARSNAELYEPLLRLPDTPTIVVMLRSAKGPARWLESTVAALGLEYAVMPMLPAASS